MFADLVGLADSLGVALVVGVAVALCPADAVALGAAVSTVAPGSAIGELCVEVNCGGVTAKTAPSPPTVPVAINIARFMSVPSLLFL